MVWPEILEAIEELYLEGMLVKALDVSGNPGGLNGSKQH